MKKMDLSEKELKQCKYIIHGASTSAAAAGAGLAQIPLADHAIITPIQIAMIVALGKVFNQEVSKSAATAILSSAAASFVGRSVTQVLTGWVPVLGNVVNTATAAGITEAIGWLAVDKFAKNQYMEILEKYPMDEQDDIAIDSENKTSDNYSSSKAAMTLEERIDEFISGKKSKKLCRDDYDELLNEIEKKLINVTSDDPLHDLYDTLINL